MIPDNREKASEGQAPSTPTVEELAKEIVKEAAKNLTGESFKKAIEEVSSDDEIVEKVLEMENVEQKISEVLDRFFPCEKEGHEEYDPANPLSKYWCGKCEDKLQLKAQLLPIIRLAIAEARTAKNAENIKVIDAHFDSRIKLGDLNNFEVALRRSLRKEMGK